MTDDPQAERPVACRSPGTRTLYCVICARQESGWQPVAAADVRGDTECDFCGGLVLAVAVQRLGAVVARYAAASVPSAPADRAAVLREAANGLAALGPLDSLVSAPAAWTEAIETLRRMADQIAEDELRRMAGEAQQPEAQADDRAAIIAEILPVWEAVYEPGTVSDYLIGYANDEVPAKAAAESWMRSQAEVTGRLEWVPDEQLATGRYDRWFELIERHADGIDTGPGLIVRRRAEKPTA